MLCIFAQNHRGRDRCGRLWRRDELRPPAAVLNFTGETRYPIVLQLLLTTRPLSLSRLGPLHRFHLLRRNGLHAEQYSSLHA